MSFFKASAAFILSLLPVATLAGIAETSNSGFCYSAYHLQQQMKLSVNFAETIQQQKIKLNIDIHVRETPVSSRNLSSHYSNRNIHSFIILVSPNTSKVNGVEMEISQRYQHPFLVLIDADSGELITLKSSTQDKSILNEYLSIFDLFQYSKVRGEYLYRNGNGKYQASIQPSENNPRQIIRKNTGYLKADHETDHRLQIEQSFLSVTPANTQSECFYQKGQGVEVLKTSLSKHAFVHADASMIIESDKQRALEPSHFFYTLTDDIQQWPTFKKEQIMSQEQAFSKLPYMTAKLNSLLEDDAQFLNAMLVDKSLWSFLPEYIMQNGISNELSLKLFWALDRIDSTASVDTLAQLAISPLAGREQLRAAMALASTSAPFSQLKIELLENQLTNLTHAELTHPEQLTFIRMLGAMANRRDAMAPLQSSHIRQLLYSQAGTSDESVNAAIIDAIGNLGTVIDAEGEAILLQGLSTGSVKERLVSATALTKIPYNSDNSDIIIDQLGVEQNPQIKSSIIKAMGQTDNTDLKVKHHLLSLVGSTKNSTLKNSSLHSLKKIDYEFQPEDIQLLETRLSHETNSASQKLLATLILKHRRKHKNK